MLLNCLKDQEREREKILKNIKDNKHLPMSEAGKAEALIDAIDSIQKQIQIKNNKLSQVSSGGISSSGSIRDNLKTLRTNAAKLEAQDFALLQEINFLNNEIKDIKDKQKHSNQVFNN